MNTFVLCAKINKLPRLPKFIYYHIAKSVSGGFIYIPELRREVDRRFLIRASFECNYYPIPLKGADYERKYAIKFGRPYDTTDHHVNDSYYQGWHSANLEGISLAGAIRSGSNIEQRYHFSHKDAPYNLCTCYIFASNLQDLKTKFVLMNVNWQAVYNGSIYSNDEKYIDLAIKKGANDWRQNIRSSGFTGDVSQFNFRSIERNPEHMNFIGKDKSSYLYWVVEKGFTALNTMNIRNICKKGNLDLIKLLIKKGIATVTFCVDNLESYGWDQKAKQLK